MRTKITQVIGDITILLAISFIPFLWFPKGYIVTGNDAGYPINIIETFKNRLYTWYTQDNFGVDNTVNVGAVPIHAVEAGFYKLGLSTTDAQKLAFVFWFFAMEMSMYLLALSLWRDIAYRYFPLFAAVVYAVNFFLLALWRYGAGTTFSAYCALPLVTLFGLRVLRRQMHPVYGAVCLSLVLFVFNAGGGFSLPLFGGLLITVLTALVYFFVTEPRVDRIDFIRRVTILFIVAGICSAALSAFWLLPFVGFVQANYVSAVAAHGGSAGVISWTDSVSKSTSIINLFRLQGIPEWYDNPTHPFSGYFLANPFLIVFSFLFAPLAYLSLLWAREARQKRVLVYFATLSLVAVFFAAGTHPPTGWIFAQLMLHIPGFEVFRSAQYKFIPALYLSFGILISFSLNYLFYNLKKSGKFRLLFVSGERVAACIVIFFLLAYHFPFFQKGFFYYAPNLTTLLKVPSYVEHFDTWSSYHVNQDERFLVLPRHNTSWKSAVYDWGYFSLYSLFNLIHPQPFVEYQQNLNDAQLALVNRLAIEIRTGGPLVSPISTLLQTPYVLLTNDADILQEGKPSESPSIYAAALAKYPTVWKDGPWQLYRTISAGPQGKFIALNSVTDYIGQDSDITGAVISGSNNFYKKTHDTETIPNLPISNTVYAVSCASCQFDEDVLQSSGIPYTNILPGSLLYEIKLWRERSLENADLPPDQAIRNRLGLSAKRLSEVKSLLKFKKNENLVNPTIEKARGNWHYIAQLLSTNTAKTTDFALTRLVQSYALMEKTEISGIDTFMIPDSVQRELSQYVNDLNDVLSRITNEQIKWSSTKLYNLSGHLTQGELFMDANSLGRSADGSINLPTDMRVNGQLQHITPVVSGEKVSLGRRNLQGADSIALQFSGEKNLLVYSGGISVNDFANDNKCIQATIENYNWENRYKLTIDSVSGWPPDSNIYLLRHRNTDSTGSVAVNYLSKPDLVFSYDRTSITSQTLYFSGNDGDTGATVYLCTTKLSDPGILIPNIHVEQETAPPVYIRLEDSASTNAIIQPVSYVRIDPTKYRVQISKNAFPTVLVMNENFNNKWKVYDTGTGGYALPAFIQTWFRKPLAESFHFTIYGYANAWYLDKKPAGDLVVEFYPQQLMYKGIVISVIGLIVCFVILVVVRRRRFHEHRL